MSVLDLIAVGPNLVTACIVVVMIVLFYRAWISENRTIWASYLVQLGIFGTFLGIAIGLFGLDVGGDAGDLRRGVPVLVDGMKLAFISSALGLLFNLLLRSRSLNSSAVGSDEAKTADDIFMVLVEQTKHLENLQSALVGSADSTLLTQLQLIRTEANDHAKMIGSSLDHFAETLAENNSAAFIEALEGAVREFNDKISQQFGENFAQLNDAVGRLLEWQEQYKEELNAMHELFVEIERRLKEASSEIGEVAQQTQSLAHVSEQQSEWLQAQRTAQIELEARLEAFSGLAEDARSALPVISTNLEQMTSGVGEQVETMLGSMAEVVGHVENSAGTLSEQVDSSLAGMKDQVLESNELSQSAIRGSVEELEQTLSASLTQALESSEANHLAIQDAVGEGLSVISTNLEQMTSGVGEQVETMLGSMAEVVGHVENSAGTLSEQVDSSLAGMKDQVLESNELSQSAIRGSVEELEQTLSASLTQALESSEANHLAIQDAVGEGLSVISTNLEQMTSGVGEQVETMLGSMAEVVGHVENSAGTLSEQVDSSLAGMKDQVLESNELSQSAIRGSVEELEQTLSASLTQALESSEANHLAIQDAVGEGLSVISTNLEQMTSGVGEQVETMLGSMAEVVGHVENSAGTLSEQVDSSLAGMKDQVLELNSRTRRVIQDSIEDLDQALGDALVKSLESLGGELASLSRQFVDDYTPLTEKLRDVVRIAEEVQV